MNPSVSVILPVYNAAPYVKEAVQSILSQEYENFELIIIDDGSADASGTILRDLASKDTRIHLIQRENKGLIATLNEGLSLAHAPLIARMDADDVSLPNRLTLQVERMMLEPGLAVLGGGIRYMDSAGSVGRAVAYPMGRKVDTTLLWGAPVAHPATMIRTEAARCVGGYPDAFPHAEDYAFWVRLREQGRIDNLSQTILHYRMHGQSMSHVHAPMQRSSTLRAQALWLAGTQPSLALMTIPSDIDFLEALPLSAQERIEILVRMLALSPHLIGDESSDAVAAQWLHVVRQAPRSPTLRQGLARFHLRAARCSHQKRFHKFMHLYRAVVASPKACLALAGKYFFS